MTASLRTDLGAWLDRGRSWLAAMQACGLAGASGHLLAHGRAWAAEGGHLGWQAVARLMDQVVDGAATPARRAQALLDLRVWVATAHSLHGWPGPDPS
jgi:hypothetical protein